MNEQKVTVAVEKKQVNTVLRRCKNVRHVPSKQKKQARDQKKLTEV